MRIDISGITKVNGASLEVKFNEPIPELGSLVEGFEFSEPVSFNGKLANSGGVLKLEGHLKTEYVVKCYRCLKEIPDTLNIPIREEFLKHGMDPDDECYTYEGSFIELDRVLKDNIILSLPMKQVCSKECRGLCPKCGANLNETVCDCREEEPVNPNMEALKNFFNN